MFSAKALTRPAKQRWPATLVVGLLLIALCEGLLAVDYYARGGIIVPHAPLPAPNGILQEIARQVAVLMTPLCWTGFLLAMDGVLAHSAAGSPVRRRPRRFLLCYLASIPVWLFFDWVNFTFMGAWAYYGLSENLALRWIGYGLAFGAISPAMFLAAEVAARAGLGRLRGRALRVGRRGQTVLIGLGLAFVLFPFLAQAPIGNLTLWLGVALLLDPINLRLGQPSILGDWQAGRYGRMLALMAGGLLCGFLWEFWNYWADAKWTYHLPFLGPLQDIRYFEMPLPGLAGFLPFAIECWAALQTAVWLARRLGVRVEPLGRCDIL